MISGAVRAYARRGERAFSAAGSRAPRARSSWIFAVALFAFAALAVSLPRSAFAQAPRVHVRGTSRIDARASRSQGKLSLSGTLVDDAARPVAGEKITVSVAAKSDPAHELPLSLASPAPCVDGGESPILERADTLTLKTDDGGRFCVRLSLAVDRYVAHLGFAGASNIDPTTLDLPIDLALRPLTLRFDPPPRVVSLDEPTTFIETVATIEDEGSTNPAVDIALTLSNESGTILGTGQTNAAGRARFGVPSAQLGAPGKGELRVAFAGNAETSSSVHAAQIERRTHVEVAVPDAKDGRLAPGSPEDGVTLIVVATPQSAASGGAAGIPGGSIEARVGDTIVGAAPLEAGRAHLIVTFATASSADIPVRLRYVPDAPWFEAANDTTVTLPVREPSLLRRVPLVAAGALVVAWLILGRSSRARASKEKEKRKRAVALGAIGAAGEARLDVVRAAPDAHGWTGYVVDAHDGYAIGRARVAVERPGFDRVETVSVTETGEDGAFTLPAVAPGAGDRLVVEGPLHAALAQALPPSGELAIALVLRKRALLDRLIAWARRRGKPFDSAPEPTPGHVRRAAGSEFAVARWADAVERAAYAGGDVDARAEAEIDRLAPPIAPVTAAAPANADADRTVADEHPPAGMDRER